MLSDPQGDIRTVEISANYAATREMIDGQIINTNHYTTKEMQRHEIPRNAIYFGKRIPKALVGVRVHESSEQRLKRANELLNAKDSINENKITTILRDHSKDNKPSNLTICQHG